MAFEKRKPTEEEIKYLESFEIRCPYGDKSSFDLIYCDTDRNFYMFYIMGPGFERESLPMYFGIVWNETPMILGVYKGGSGNALDGFHIVWDLYSLFGKNREYIPINCETIQIIKEALIAAHGRTTCKVIDTKFKF